MKLARRGGIFAASLLAGGLGVLALAFAAEPAPSPEGEKPEAADDAAVKEARVRARLLHETIHGSLQVMHRDFFKEEERSMIPSASLEDVFDELHKTWKVEVKWLAVDAKAMTVDHKPDTKFDRDAVKAISGGAEMWEEADAKTYQYAGVITLGNRCLKCHVPDRTSLEDRKAAVVISMPLKMVEAAEE